MNSATKPLQLPELTSSFLKNIPTPIDNIFNSLWEQLKMDSLLSRLKIRKRSGSPARDVIYLLLLWVWLKNSSISMFCKDSIGSFASMHKDALYDFLNREDIPWRKMHQRISHQCYQAIKKDRIKAFVFDDTIKQRRGKAMPGVSYHFDHVTGKQVKGQQLLVLGLVSNTAFIPLDSELFISQSKAQLDTTFKDNRSHCGKRFKCAIDDSKPDMAKQMLKRAQREGIDADYLIADAWFGTKTMILTSQALDLTAVLRMKKNAMKYRVAVQRGQQTVYQLLDAKEIYKRYVKGRWKKRHHFYQTVRLNVDINLSNDSAFEQWVSVSLLFVNNQCDESGEPSAKHQWALFLTTRPSMSEQDILEIYALRWSIEVYFKEAKQELGLLKEQSRTYAAYIASIHLTAIRYCFLLYAKKEHQSLGESRKELANSLQMLDFATRLWGLFRALISGALTQVDEFIDGKAEYVFNSIEQHIKQYFIQVLQFDTLTLRLEACQQSDEVP